MTTAAAEPVIIGVRHHSPACARLVAARIAELRPAHVLIEGPADFNHRIDELHLGHRLPIAIHTYLSTPDGHRSSWSPLAEHSPEWQALIGGREVGARVTFIDLPAWHDVFGELENRWSDAADAEEAEQVGAYQDAVAERLGIDNSDSLWEHLFEAQLSNDHDQAHGELQASLRQWFELLRGTTRGSVSNQLREELMAHWIAWALATGDGPVLVVCGGYHAPMLARAWRDVPADQAAHQPATPVPDDADNPDVRYGSFLIPFSFHRLDAFTGYASGMPSPAYHQWVWEAGPEQAGLRLLESVRNRLRARKLPVSTATMVAVHTHAHGLARLRGHRVPLRTDWLDAMAASWVDEALDVPVPWSQRGPIRPGTDPVLVEMMAASSGDGVGVLAPGTPQPPLVASVAAELEAHDLPTRGTVTLDLLGASHDTSHLGDRARSRVLHRLVILQIPGTQRLSGPRLALGNGTPAGPREHHETWQLSLPSARLPALIEAGAWGGTLTEAAQACWSSQLAELTGDVAGLATAINEAVWAGLSTFADRVLDELRAAVGAETSLGSLGGALRVLLPLLRHPELVGIDRGSGTGLMLASTVEAITDRALWLFEPPGQIEPKEVDRHLLTVMALRDVVRTLRTHPGAGLTIQPDRVVAVLTRKAMNLASDPASRGASLGALITLDALPAAAKGGAADPLTLLAGIRANRLGDALAGLIALAREELLVDADFVAGLDRIITDLDGHDFVAALPALRGAFAWLPSRERGHLAERLLALHGQQPLSGRSLTAPVVLGAVETATATLVEAEIVALLDQWGLS